MKYHHPRNRRQDLLLIGMCCLIGQPGVDYIDAVVDQVEWTNPRYCHQN